MALKTVALLKFDSSTSQEMALHQANACLAPDSQALPLFEEARNAFLRQAGKQFGFFDESCSESSLKPLLAEWQGQRTDFLAFANQTGKLLHKQLGDTELALSAALLIAEESLLGQHYLYLFWLPLNNILLLDDGLQPVKSTCIAEKPSLGLRIDLGQWAEDHSPKYLTLFASRGEASLAKAWKAFCGFSEGIDTSLQTREFLQIVDNFSEQLPEESAREVKSQVLDYCVSMDKVGQPVVIDALSSRLHDVLPATIDSPARFSGYVSEHQKQPEKEILTHRASLKRHIRYFGRDESMSISFSAERFGRDISYNVTDGSLKIASVPKSLKNQLVSPEKNK